jgi:hypothetical protein
MMFVLAVLGIFFAGLAWAQKAAGPRRPTPVMLSVQGQKGVVPLTASNYTVTPATITFTSSTPDNTQTSATTEVSFKVSGSPATFTIYAKASAANFTGCNTPPASSVTVTCGTATGVTCAASAPLSSTGNGTTVATGSGNHNPSSFYVTYTFQDAWNYSVGTACSLTVTYTYLQ